MSISVNFNTIHDPHPQLRAEDWRSPLIRRLLGSDTYQDGTAEVTGSFIGQNDSMPTTQALTVAWTGFTTDFNKVVKTYQAPVITEFATWGWHAASSVRLRPVGNHRGHATRGSADYWLGDKDLMLEVSGESGDLARLCDEKSEQLANNPYGKDGYVCVANYSDAEARLWFFTAVLEEEDDDV